MGQPLKLLLVEDSQDDADMLLVHLRRAGFEPQWTRVQTEADFLKQIKNSPEIILSDYSMPQFDGMLALQLLGQSGLDIPFILISGTVGEDIAVNAMKQGADDYLLKDRITRLGVAVEHALGQKRLRDERWKMQERLMLQATALETAANAVVITNRAGLIQWVNPAFTASTGYRSDEAIGKTPRLLKSGKHDAAFYAELWKTILSGQTWRGEFINRRKDGSLCYDEHIVTPVRGFGGKITHFIGIMHDVTERKRTEAELRRAHEQVQHLLEHSPVVIYSLRLEGETAVPVMVSDNMIRLTGFTPGESCSYDWWASHLHPDDRDRTLVGIKETIDKGTLNCEYRIRHKDGHYVWVEDSRRLVRNAAGIPSEIVGVWTVITERKQAEEALRESEARFRQLAENVSEVFWVTDVAKSKMLYISPAYETIWGRTCESLYQYPQSWMESIHFDDWQRVRKAAIERQIKGTYNEIYRILHADGSLRWIHDRAFPVRNAHGEVYRIVGVAADVTLRKRAELRTEVQHTVTRVLADAAPLRETVQKILQTICRQLEWDVGELWMVDPMARKLKCTEIWHPPSTEFGAFAENSRKTEYSMEEGLPGQAWASGEPIWIPDIRQYGAVRRLIEAAALGLRGVICFPVRLKGEVLGVIKFFSARVREPDSELLDMFAAVGTQIGQFIERKKLEQQFLQAQKMEAIGTMAGGIAHDFNNILAAINGHTEIARMDSEGNAGVIESLNNVLKASQRATDLVGQILAFSRRQEQRRVITQLRPLVNEALKLLRASFPSTIQFKLFLANDSPTVLADPSQIHQVIMNLCTNAWHAMKDRPGCLSVRLEKINVSPDMAVANPGLPPNVYARLSVGDTGKGMDKATLDRIFEPFFTTKGPGEGTGLGLSVVHGIMQSHDGIITVKSQPGEGTTFDLYFPAYAGGLPETKSQSEAIPRGNGELILLIDDEEALVELGKTMLERLGYRAEVQTNVLAALDGFRGNPGRFAAVVTDLTMPEMTGTEFARHLLQVRPDLPIILNTGYSASLSTESVRELGIRALLLKPLTMESLGTAVHRVLNFNKTT